jgi:hypothetical protein
MLLSSFDILRKNRRGKPFLPAVERDLETACLRLSRLTSLMPREYFVSDSRTHHIVAANGGLPVASRVGVNISQLTMLPMQQGQVRLMKKLLLRIKTLTWLFNWRINRAKIARLQSYR